MLQRHLGGCIELARVDQAKRPLKVRQRGPPIRVPGVGDLVPKAEAGQGLLGGPGAEAARPQAILGRRVAGTAPEGLRAPSNDAALRRGLALAAKAGHAAASIDRRAPTIAQATLGAQPHPRRPGAG